MIADRIAKLLGLLWYYLDKRHRNLANENLSHAFSEELSDLEIKAILKKVFINLAKMLFEITRGYRWKPEELSKHFIVNGLDNLRTAHEKGKGVLLLTGHLGNWEMSVHLNTLSGIDGSGVYRTLDSPALNRYVLEKRQITGGKLYPLKDAVMGIFHEMSMGNFIGFLCDQNSKRGQGVFVDFFGRKACANKGLAQFAMSTSAPVVPFFIVREGGKFLLDIGPEIPLVDTGKKENDLIANTQNYNTIIENMIRKFPDQWLWVHNRWKNQPL